jgi:hypothetical protein
MSCEASHYRSCWSRWPRKSSDVLSACEGLDNEHRGTAVPADEGGLLDGDVAVEGFASVRGSRDLRLMQQEAADELVGTQRHCFVARPAVSSVVLPPEGDPALITGDEPTVGNRYDPE